ncbi:protein PsiE [Bifidobacterium gallicum DSM 20093 = LMG 11596]|nr:protein PsiE [Bifidobacterium gallicum DSM 20093 = LMG 11596]
MAKHGKPNTMHLLFHRVRMVCKNIGMRTTHVVALALATVLCLSTCPARGVEVVDDAPSSITQSSDAPGTSTANSTNTNANGARAADAAARDAANGEPDGEFTTKTDTVSPSSSVINLFDYWEVANGRDTPTPGWGHVGPGGPTNSDEAINAGHAFKFVRNSGDGNGLGEFNQYTNSANVRPGIVSNLLSYGYPKLSGENGFAPGTSEQARNESLDYLFNPLTKVPDGRATYANVKNLFSYTKDGYLSYNSNKHYAQFDEHTNSFILMNEPASCSQSFDGQFFPFDAPAKIAGHRSEGNGCQAGDINHFFGINIIARFVQRNGGFADAQHKQRTTFSFSGDDDVWVFVDDVLVADLGGLHNEASVAIDFVNGHITVNNRFEGTLKSKFEDAGRVQGVEWSTTDPTFADETSHTLKFYYLERGSGESNMHIEYNLVDIPVTSLYKVDQYGDPLKGAVFATYHGRQEYDDNGLPVVGYLKDGTDNDYVAWPAGAVVDQQTGNVYADEAQQNLLFTPTYKAVTDDFGEILFANENGALSVGELKQLLGEEFVLRELYVPDGYRTVSDDAVLYFAGDMLQSRDPYGTGVWAAPSSLVTATNSLYLINGDSQPTPQPYYTLNNAGEYESEGTLFAVVLKRNGAAWTDLQEGGDWTPVYGNADMGYKEASQKGVSGAVETVKYMTGMMDGVRRGYPEFTARANGMQGLFSNLPGFTTQYYSYVEEAYFGGDSGKIADILQVCATSGGTQPLASCQEAINQGVTREQLEALDSIEYYVGYFWTEEHDIASAKEENTWRVHSHRNSVEGLKDDEFMGFDVKWGSTIKVPNVENRLIVQNHVYREMPRRTDGVDDNDAYNGSWFAMYHVGETPVQDEGSSPVMYYLGNSTDGSQTNVPIYLNPDPKRDGLLTDAAWIVDRQTGQRVGNIGTYLIDQSVQSADSTQNPQAGDITVTIGDATYTIPVARNAEGQRCLKHTLPASDQENPIKDDGALYFSKLLTGTYVVRQITAPVNPDGEKYAINIAESKVAVDSTAIYANAGGDRNGVLVGNGVGYLAKTLNMFASNDAIDETLRWVASCLRVNDAQTFSKFAQFLASSDEFGEAPWGKRSENTSHTAISSDSTTTLHEAMVTYLQFAPDAATTFFDYQPNPNQSGNGRFQTTGPYVMQQMASIDGDLFAREARDGESSPDGDAVPGAGQGNAGNANDSLPTMGDGEGKMRLYTDEGWSKIDIYQDYGFGLMESQRQQANGSHVTYASLWNREITGLFSNSTFVDYYNSPTAGPAIVKVKAETEQWDNVPANPNDPDNTDTVRKFVDYETKLSGAKFNIQRKFDDSYRYLTRSCPAEPEADPDPQPEPSDDRCTYDWAPSESDSDQAYLFTSDEVGVVWQNIPLVPYANGVNVQYRLEEVTPPTGYKALRSTIDFELYNVQNSETGAQDGSVTMIRFSDAPEADKLTAQVKDPETNETKTVVAARIAPGGMTMYVGNYPDPNPQPDPDPDPAPGVMLPNAGATFIWRTVAVGLVLTVIALAMLRRALQEGGNSSDY